MPASPSTPGAVAEASAANWPRTRSPEVLGAFVRERTDPARAEKPTVADVLNAFLTLVDDRPEGNPMPSHAAGAGLKPPADVQAGLTVLGRLPRHGVSRADLTGAHLTGAQLTGADLTGAQLTGADLSGAQLTGANLSGAEVGMANLSSAFLHQPGRHPARLHEDRHPLRRDHRQEPLHERSGCCLTSSDMGCLRR
jgi:hypothetical protein